MTKAEKILEDAYEWFNGYGKGKTLSFGKDLFGMFDGWCFHTYTRKGVGQAVKRLAEKDDRFQVYSETVDFSGKIVQGFGLKD